MDYCILLALASLLLSLSSFPIQIANSNSSVSTFSGICAPGFVGNIRNPANCSTFITCDISGAAIVRPCPADLCYNELVDWCDWCYNVPICKDHQLTTPVDEVNPPCPSASEMLLPVFIGNPSDCTKFYFCRQDGSYGGEGTCATGLWFEFSHQTCITPWSENCLIA